MKRKGLTKAQGVQNSAHTESEYNIERLQKKIKYIIENQPQNPIKKYPIQPKTPNNHHIPKQTKNNNTNKWQTIENCLAFIIMY